MSATSHDGENSKPGQQVITACAFIHQDFKGVEMVFVPKRADTKKFLPGVYELPGGHVDFGETPVDGLKREIFEEFGMRISVGDPFYVFTYTNGVKKSHSIEVVYFAAFENEIENIQLNPADHSDFKWISENEIPLIISENKKEDDQEMRAIKRGFEILRGSKLAVL